MTEDQIILYGIAALLVVITVVIYLLVINKGSADTLKKVEKACEDGFNEPVSLYPSIDPNKCINSGACIKACPEKDILGIVSGRATLINASQCVGHGACFHSCPVEAISLVIGTEKRGVDLPHLNQNYETNMPGIFIAGELGGMGLIKNSVEQGQSAVNHIIKGGIKKKNGILDLVIIGAGPAGISASLMAKKHNLNFMTLEQDSLGGTVFTFPRSKIVMTSPMDLPLYGKVHLFNTSKTELLSLWQKVLSEHKMTIREHVKVEDISGEKGDFLISTNTAEEIHTQYVLLTIGRRGSPRKLNIPGEDSEKVAYRLLEPENISGKKILVVGGGDSAVESALLLAENNQVCLSYRKDNFSRIKPQNREAIDLAHTNQSLKILFESNLKEIRPDSVSIEHDGQTQDMDNDLVYIFAGGELPTQFLNKSGVKVTKRFGYVMKKYG